MEHNNINDHLKYSEEGFTKELLIKNNHMLCFLLNLMPGQMVPKHNHENSDGLAYMVKGSMLFTIGEKEVCVAEGDVISFDGNEMVGISNNTGINASCMITLNSSAYNGTNFQEIGFKSGEVVQ